MIRLLLALSVIWLPFVGAGSQDTAPNLAKRACAECSCDDLALLGLRVGLTYGHDGAGWCEDGSLVLPMVRPGEEGDPHLAQKAAETGWLLGYNEPDNCRPGGWCLSLAYVVERWPGLESICPAGECVLVSPNPSQDAPEWLDQFRAAFLARWGRTPRMDRLAAHCYFAHNEVGCKNLLAGYVAKAQEWGAGGVLVQEFAAIPGTEHTISEARMAAERLMAWMDAEPGIKWYFWFAGRLGPCAGYANGFAEQALFWPNCNCLTSWGKWFVGDGR